MRRFLKYHAIYGATYFCNMTWGCPYNQKWQVFAKSKMAPFSPYFAKVVEIVNVLLCMYICYMFRGGK